MSAFHAVRAAHGSVLASRKFSVLGMRTSVDSEKTPVVRSVPSLLPPRPIWSFCGVNGPSRWVGRMCVQTLSPTRKRVTFEPMARTLPDASEPGTTGRDRGKGYVPCRCGLEAWGEIRRV
jgi:hypothetical protein